MIHRAIAELAAKIVTDESHGYSQINRMGDGTTSIYWLNSLGENVYVHGGDYDCSSMVWEILSELGLILPVSNFWTGNMPEILLENGFTEVGLDELRVGDILWREGHTEVYIGEALTAGFVRSETGGIDGETGDQDGGEARIAHYRQSQWEKAFRAPYIGKGNIKMECIIKLTNSTGHWYFDGQKLHMLTLPEELVLLDKISQATNNRDMPRVYWSQTQLDMFFKLMK